MTKIYMMSITKNIDEQVWEQKVIEKIFEKNQS